MMMVVMVMVMISMIVIVMVVMTMVVPVVMIVIMPVRVRLLIGIFRLAHRGKRLLLFQAASRGVQHVEGRRLLIEDQRGALLQSLLQRA